MGTISKALGLLDFFSRRRAEIGLTEFVKLSGRDKATVHRHLVELEANGFLEQNPVSRAYRLGPALLRLTAVREAAFPTRALLRPIVTALSETVGELAHASLLQGDMLAPITHADPGLHGTQVHFDEGEMLPLHATSSGLAVLAFGRLELAERILARPLAVYTTRTITDPQALRAAIETTRANGLGQLVGAFDDEVVSVGAAIFGQGGDVVGAISVAVPKVRAHPDRMRDIAGHLRAAARDASRSLGGTFRVPSNPQTAA